MNATINENKSIEAINRVLQAIEDIKKGKMVVMVDDEDRENEGDLVYAANLSTPEKVNFMASHAKGLICVALSKETAHRLDLAPMVKNNDSSYETAFTVSVDAKDAATGISASERDMTIKILSNQYSKKDDLVRPGHIFPLIAKEGGVLVRTGHTEGSTDLCHLAGMQSSSVICEIMKEDGTMARRPDLDLFCQEHDLNIVYISDIVEYRMMNESLVKITNNSMETFLGQNANKYTFLDHKKTEHYVYSFGTLKPNTNVKFHNIMKDIELLSSTEKYEDLMKSIKYLQENNGVLVFLSNSSKKMKEIREYGIGAQILNLLGIKEINLITTKTKGEFVGINGFGLDIKERISL